MGFAESLPIQIENTISLHPTNFWNFAYLIPQYYLAKKHIRCCFFMRILVKNTWIQNITDFICTENPLSGKEKNQSLCCEGLWVIVNAITSILV